MIYVLSGGGVSAYAFILVDYPAGSTVTCTNASGKKNISNTKMLFYVKKGTPPIQCTVSCTDGTHTASKSVSITFEGQGVQLALSYEYVVFENGVVNPDMGAMKLCYDKQGGSTWHIQNNCLRLVSSDSSNARGVTYGGFTNPVNVNADRRYLCFEVVQANGNDSKLGVSSNNGEGFSAFVNPGSVSSSSERVTKYVDLQQYYGNNYIKVYSWGGATTIVSRIWLQSEVP